jgi:hypothetical protein
MITCKGREELQGYPCGQQAPESKKFFQFSINHGQEKHIERRWSLIHAALLVGHFQHPQRTEA